MSFEEWWDSLLKEKKAIEIGKSGWYRLVDDDPFFKDIARLAWESCRKGFLTSSGT